MDLQKALLEDHSRAQMLKIVKYIGADSLRFKQLIDLFLKGDYRLTQRASWPLSNCVEKHPELLNPYFLVLLDQLSVPAHNAVHRNIVRLLQFVEIPELYSGRVMNLCFDLLMKAKEPVANKAFALTVLGNLAKTFPEIKNEILLCIEDQLPHSSPGFQSRARKVRAVLNTIT